MGIMKERRSRPCKEHQVGKVTFKQVGRDPEAQRRSTEVLQTDREKLEVQEEAWKEDEEQISSWCLMPYLFVYYVH